MSLIFNPSFIKEYTSQRGYWLQVTYTTLEALYKQINIWYNHPDRAFPQADTDCFIATDVKDCLTFSTWSDLQKHFDLMEPARITEMALRYRKY